MNGEQIPVTDGWTNRSSRADSSPGRSARTRSPPLTVQARDMHVDPDAAELIEATLHLPQCGVDMRQWQHDVGGNLIGIAVRRIGIAVRRIGIAVVQHADGSDTLRLLRQIGRAVRRQDLLLDAGGIHQFEPTNDVSRRVRNRMLRDPGLYPNPDTRGKSVTHQLAEVLWYVMRVDITDHDCLPFF